MRTTHRVARTLAVAALGIGLAAGAQAQTPALSVIGGNDSNNLNWCLGWQFTINSNLSVTSLGFYDDLGNGLTESHPVGIFDNSGALVTSATVNPGDPLVGTFRYASISPYNLVAGASYRIAAVTGSENYNYRGAITTAPEVTYTGDYYARTSALVYPTSTTGLTGGFGPNFQFTSAAAVPEPGEWATLGIAALSAAGLTIRARRRRAR